MKRGLGRIVLNSMAFWVLVSCTCIALLMLWAGGGSFLQGLQLFFGILTVGPEGEGSLRYLFVRSLRTFGSVSVAVLGGLSLAFALTLFVSYLGPIANRVLAVMGRWLSYVVPMGVAFGIIYACVHRWELPIESLLPIEYQFASDTWLQVVGRNLWSWLLPSMVLSLFVFGHGLSWFNERFIEFSKQPLALGLRARGVNQRGWIFLHGLALSRESFRRALLQGLPWLLACTLVVEEAFHFRGIGEFGAQSLRTGNAAGLATFIHACGWLLAGWLGAMEYLEQRFPSKDLGWKPTLYRSKSRCLEALFGVLLGSMCLLTGWFWDALVPSQAGWFQVSRAWFDNEVVHALFGAAGATLIVVAASLVVAWTRKSPNDFRSKILQGVVVLPLLPLAICGLATLKWSAPFGTCVLSLTLAIYGSIGVWRLIRERQASNVYLASVTMGASSGGMYARILWPTLLPYVLKYYFVSAATMLVWQCFANYFGLGGSFASNFGDHTWGALFFKQMDLLLDEATPLFPPSFLLASAGFTLQYLGELLSEAIKPTQPSADHGKLHLF